MSSWASVLRWGVIDDARAEHQRRGRAAVVIVAMAIAACTGGYLAFGTSGNVPIPPPGHTTGSLRELPASAFAYWVTPDLTAGNASLDFRVTGIEQWGMGRRRPGAARAHSTARRASAEAPAGR